MTTYKCARCSQTFGWTIPYCVLTIPDDCSADAIPPTNCPYEGAAQWKEEHPKTVAKDQAVLFL